MKKIILIHLCLSLFIFTTESCKRKEGCTNSLACNYNADAKIDNGSCLLAKTWYQDLNGDGTGNAAISKIECIKPLGYADNANDTFDVMIEKKQRSTVVYVGATWCPSCGTNGEPAKLFMEATYGNDVVVLNSQYGDAITKKGEFGEVFGKTFQSFVSSGSTPYAYYCGFNYTMVHRGFSSSSGNNNAASKINIDNILSKTPEVGIAAIAIRTDNTVTVQTQCVFYNEINTIRYISVYLLEDGVMANQTFVSGPKIITEHNNVLRATSIGSTGVLGLNEIGSSFTINQKNNGTYTINYNNAWNASKLQVAVVVWTSNTPDKISNSIIVNVN